MDASEREDFVTPFSLQMILDFLSGEKPLDGTWFGLKDNRHAPYWWRSHLRSAITKNKEKALRDFAEDCIKATDNVKYKEIISKLLNERINRT